MVDARANELKFELDNREIVVQQSPGMLNSNRPRGTTGAVVWQTSPMLASWLIQPSCLLWTAGILHRDAIVVELGCGISGLLGLALSPLVSSYTLSDQDYVMRALRKNLDANQPEQPRKFSKKQKGILRTVCLDWEEDSASTLRNAVANLDLVVASDCIYNDFLIEPFISTCMELCRRDESTSKPTVIVVAQQ